MEWMLILSTHMNQAFHYLMFQNKEIETEDHLKQITERVIGRIENEYQKLEKNAIEQ